MAAFGKGVHRFSTILNWFAGSCLIGMTALTCADVVLRLFRHPILGTYEIVGFLGTAVASLAVAYTTVERGHVAVSILVLRLSHRVQVIIHQITHLLSIVLFGFLTMECIRFGNDLRVSGETSLTLTLPFFPLLYGMSFSFLIVCIILWLDFWNVLTGREKPWYVP
ncbi:MAG: TRAP transporter small permease [Deltaproteobacteria bacterium]|nr:MAG: TRAP transporter small permease [Deltaproteobacteria bacterium]